MLERGVEFSLLTDAVEDGSRTLVQLAQISQPLLEGRPARQFAIRDQAMLAGLPQLLLPQARGTILSRTRQSAIVKPIGRWLVRFHRALYALPALDGCLD
jgi:hypothetical protein